jgi:hypothetical protein
MAPFMATGYTADIPSASFGLGSDCPPWNLEHGACAKVSPRGLDKVDFCADVAARYQKPA